MTTTPVFTRYLYLKDDVEISLLSSLLHKQREGGGGGGKRCSGDMNYIIVVL